MSDAISALAIARALIRCPSVTPRDAGALRVIERLLAAAGFAVEIVGFEEPDAPRVENLYARLGSASPCLVFAGHTDVVPPGDAGAWRFDPFSGEIADGALWGRGAVDMKGGVAASVAAVLAFLRGDGPPAGSIAFLITGDEEGPAVNGTAKLLAWAQARGEKFDHCVLGEPTNPEHLGDMIKIGRRGSLNGSIVVHGRQGHVAYPHLAENPIPALMRLASALTAVPLDDGTRHFDRSNLEVTSIDVGNPAANVIPGEARARFNIRFNDIWTPETLDAELRRRCETAAEGARYALSVDPCNAIAFMTRPGPFTALVAAAVEAVTGRKPALSTTGGTSDARFIRAFCPVVEFGLVGKTMHATDERVALTDLESLAAVYRQILSTYFRGPPEHPGASDEGAAATRRAS